MSIDDGGLKAPHATVLGGFSGLPGAIFVGEITSSALRRLNVYKANDA